MVKNHLSLPFEKEGFLHYDWMPGVCAGHLNLPVASACLAGAVGSEVMLSFSPWVLPSDRLLVVSGKGWDGKEEINLDSGLGFGFLKVSLSRSEGTAERDHERGCRWEEGTCQGPGAGEGRGG